MTAFNKRHNQFEYLVMLFGLCNIPGIFQTYINNFLYEYLDVFYTTYLDDVFVYSKKEKEHTGHMLDMLKRLRDCRLQVNVNKYKFSVTGVKYLGLIISTNGISMGLEKV